MKNLGHPHHILLIGKVNIGIDMKKYVNRTSGSCPHPPPRALLMKNTMKRKIKDY
jgi:hypothetical protein